MVVPLDKPPHQRKDEQPQKINGLSIKMNTWAHQRKDEQPYNAKCVASSVEKMSSPIMHSKDAAIVASL